MTTFSTEDLERMEEDLGYHFSQPEMNQFCRNVQNSRASAAKKMLVKEGYSQEEAEAFYQFVKPRLKGFDIQWREVTADEAIKLCGDDILEILVRRHNAVHVTILANRHNGDWSVYFDREFIDVHDMHQIWVKEKKQ